jgi:hypothetical protein
MKLAAPIPGMSLTKEPGNAPWEQPPLLNTPEEALSFYMDKFEDEEALDDLLFTLEAGFPIDTMVDFLTSYGVMEGYHTVDVKMLVSPILHEYFTTLADTSGIQYREEMGPTKEERMQAKDKQRSKVLLLKAMGEEPEQIAETIKEVDAAPVTKSPMPTPTASAPAPTPMAAPTAIPEPAMAPEPTVAPEENTAPLISRPVPRMAKGGVVKKPEPVVIEEVKPTPVVEKKVAPAVEEKPKPVSKTPEFGEKKSPFVKKGENKKPAVKKAPAKKKEPVLEIKLEGEAISPNASIGQVLNALAYAAGSSDKGWGAVKTIKGGKRLLGRYQAPEDKIPAWTEEAVSRRYTAEDFLRSSETQQAVAMYRMAQDKNKYGTWEDAASVWFTGQPVAKSEQGAEYANKLRQGYKRT